MKKGIILVLAAVFGLVVSSVSVAQMAQCQSYCYYNNYYNYYNCVNSCMAASYPPIPVYQPPVYVQPTYWNPPVIFRFNWGGDHDHHWHPHHWH